MEDQLDPRPRIIEPGPVPTIGELLSTDLKRMWSYCERIGCGHSAPIALAPFAIRWRLHVSTDLIRDGCAVQSVGRKALRSNGQAGMREATPNGRAWRNSSAPLYLILTTTVHVGPIFVLGVWTLR